jgi:recombination protein RecA
MVVIDSVAALVPEAEIAGSMGDAQVGLQARLMSQAMRKLSGAIHQSKATVVFINQLRALISSGPWGPTTTTTGGLALKFYASLRIEIRRIGRVEDGTGDDKQVVGNETLIKVVKNKLAPPFREAKVDIMYGRGIVRSRELIRLGEEFKLIKKSGAWYSYGETQLGQGLSNSAAFLEENPDVAGELERAILKEAGLLRREPGPNGAQAEGKTSVPKKAKRGRER